MFNFATNKMKLQRAIASVGVNASEEQVKAEYIKIGGLLGNENTKVKDMEQEQVVESVEEVVAPVEETAPEVAEEKKEEISSEEVSEESSAE